MKAWTLGLAHSSESHGCHGQFTDHNNAPANMATTNLKTKYKAHNDHDGVDDIANNLIQ